MVALPVVYVRVRVGVVVMMAAFSFVHQMSFIFLEHLRMYECLRWWHLMIVWQGVNTLIMLNMQILYPFIDIYAMQCMLACRLPVQL